MEKEDIKKVLAEHSAWLQDKSTGIKTNLWGADLRYANLGNADFGNADLRYANFRNSNLWGANLRYTNLRYTNLRGANFRNVDLRWADFYKTSIKIESTTTLLNFKPVTSYQAYTEDQNCELTNKLLGHVYLCNIGD